MLYGDNFGHYCALDLWNYDFYGMLCICHGRNKRNFWGMCMITVRKFGVYMQSGWMQGAS